MRLEDVAKRARVSVSTVSRVVNGLPTVHAGTRKRVLAALEELSYTPNLQARSLVSGKTKTLGMIVSNLENPFYVNLYHLLETQARREGFEVLLANTNYDSEHLARALRLMQGRRVSGLALAVAEALPDELVEAVAEEIPVVSLCGAEGCARVARIHLDGEQGMQKVVTHLHSLGHTRVAYIGHPLDLKVTEGRRAAFVETAASFGMEYQTITMVDQDGPAEGRDAVRRLVSQGFNASAVVCVNDLTAIGVLRELRNRNRSVPADVSVTGYDNVTLSEFLCPSLTTVHIPRQSIARMMFRMLTAGSGEEMPSEYRVDSELVIRESTGPWRGGGLLA